ncbi:Actin-like protein arp9 [Saitoella coloradoensis]
MAPSFRDDHLVILEVGDRYHRAVLGLEDPLAPPKHVVPSCVRRTTSTSKATRDQWELVSEGDAERDLFARSDAQESSSETQDVKEGEIVWPVHNGDVVNWSAAEGLWYHILHTTLGLQPSFANPILLIHSSQFLGQQQSLLLATQLFIENLGCQAFRPLESGLASTYGYGVLSALVVDVGHSRTDVTVISETQVPVGGRATVPIGGNHFTKALAPLVEGNLRAAEALKRSGLVEVLVEGDLPTLDEVEGAAGAGDAEDVEDVAAIVAAGKTKEYLEQKAREKAEGKAPAEEAAQEEQKDNKEVEIAKFEFEGKNYLVDRNRFKATQELFGPSSEYADLITAIAHVVNALPDPEKRQEAWDNIIITGHGSKIPGLVSHILAEIYARHVLTSASTAPIASRPGFPSDSTGANTPSGSTPAPFYPMMSSGAQQVPSSARIVKLPEYFVEWKGVGKAEDSAVLGGYLVAKVVFTGREGGWVGKAEYNEKGPEAVWDL